MSSRAIETGIEKAAPCRFTPIPDPVLVHLLTYCEPIGWSSAALTCRRFHALVHKAPGFSRSFRLFYGQFPVYGMSPSSVESRFKNPLPVMPANATLSELRGAFIFSVVQIPFDKLSGLFFERTGKWWSVLKLYCGPRECTIWAFSNALRYAPDSVARAAARSLRFGFTASGVAESRMGGHERVLRETLWTNQELDRVEFGYQLQRYPKCEESWTRRGLEILSGSRPFQSSSATRIGKFFSSVGVIEKIFLYLPDLQSQYRALSVCKAWYVGAHLNPRVIQQCHQRHAELIQRVSSVNCRYTFAGIHSAWVTASCNAIDTNILMDMGQWDIVSWHMDSMEGADKRFAPLVLRGIALGGPESLLTRCNRRVEMNHWRRDGGRKESAQIQKRAASDPEYRAYCCRIRDVALNAKWKKKLVELIPLESENPADCKSSGSNPS
jgi:hypothetical protein